MKYLKDGNEMGGYLRKIISNLKECLLQASIRKKVLIGFGCFIIVFIIGIVSNNTHLRNEKEIIKDLQLEDNFFPYFEMDIQQLDILQRFTNQNEHSDLVHVKIVGKNEALGIDCTIQYELCYQEYKEGWKLENVFPEHQDEWTITEPSIEQVKESIYEKLSYFNLDEITSFTPQTVVTHEFNDTELSTNVAFSCDETGETYDFKAKGILVYILTDTGWKLDEGQSSVDYDNTKLIPHECIEESFARKYIEEQVGSEYSNIELVNQNQDLGDNYVTYTYICEKEHNFATLQRQFDVTCFFNEQAEWEIAYYESDENSDEVNWNINTTVESISHYFDTAGTDQTISYTITYPYNDQEEYAYD